MSTGTKEINFEDMIEESLIKTCGYIKTDNENFNKDYAVDTKILFDFLKVSQPKEWEKLENKYGKNLKNGFLQRLDKEIKNRGILNCLRHGIVDSPAKFHLCYFKPGSLMNKTDNENYKKNILSVSRQLHYSKRNNNSIDIVLFINGFPLATIELKNIFTGQNSENAKKQYREDRDPSETIFAFDRRTLIHFAADTDEVYMTAKLEGKNTVFIPFNKGFNEGAGNPLSDTVCKTSYLWDYVLEKESFLDIIQRFIHLDKDKEKIIFPRYHQLDVVRSLIEDIKINGSGKNYLIQHSAGSGKSNSIAWLSHHLSNLHNSDNKVIFDSIIVITDRRVLDKQLQDKIYQFEHIEGVVKKIDKSSSQLAEALNEGKKIIISTIQKFPFILEKVKDLKNKKFAIIVDEAHSSQAGIAASKLKEVLGYAKKEDTTEEEYLEKISKIENEEEEKKEDTEDIINKEMSTHGKLKNLSFFAFTATPKQRTLETFGIKTPEGRYKSFHLYSMKQAIEEGFIFDVLKNYVTYETYFKIGKSIDENPIYEKIKANKALGKYLNLHPHNLSQKTQIMIEHFRTVTKYQIQGNAKAMLVTSSRLYALRYYFEFKKYIEKMKYENEIGVLIAYSGKLDCEGKEYTEESINKFKEKELTEKFKTDLYQVLIVAEKYQTGFDEPFLHTMFVDKKLSGVKAVQTLSRVNRTCQGKESTFILDFSNSYETIKEAFSYYYGGTFIEEGTDPNLLYDLKNKLDEFRVYQKYEIDNFSKYFFKKDKKEDYIDFSILQKYIDPAVDRFKNINSNNEKEEFKSSMFKFIRTYSFLTNIIRLDDIDMHKFYSYSKLLIKKLYINNDDSSVFLDDKIELNYYRLQKIFEGAIELDKNEMLENIKHAGSKNKEKQEITLLEIVEELNGRYLVDFSNKDKLDENTLLPFTSDIEKNETLRIHAKNNSKEYYALAFKDIFIDIVAERIDKNRKFCEKILNDEEFKNYITESLSNYTYQILRQ